MIFLPFFAWSVPLVGEVQMFGSYSSTDARPPLVGKNYVVNLGSKREGQTCFHFLATLFHIVFFFFFYTT